MYFKQANLNTVKKYLLFLLFIFLTTFSWSQQTSIEWISPIPTQNTYYTHNYDKLTIKLKIKNPPPLHKKLYILVNGKNPNKYAKSETVPLSNGYFEAKVDIPPNSLQSVVLLFKDNEDKIYNSSIPLLVSRGEIPRPNLYLLAFGPKPGDIKYTDNDAIDFGQAFSRQACGDSKLYDKVIQESFVREEAQAWKIMDRIKKRIKLDTIKPNDVFILFMSSHGYRKNNEFYIKGHRYTSLVPEKTSVSSSELFEIFDHVHTKKVFFIDACKSGKEPPSDKLLRVPEPKKQLIGYTIIASSDFNADSYWHDYWENGAFTEVLINGLKGEANKENKEENTNDTITINEIYEYLVKEVPKLCIETEGFTEKQTQHPQMIRNELGDLGLFKFNKFCSSFEVFYETVKLPTGTVTIGSIKGEKGRNDDEYQRDVTITTPTYIGKYEVTNAEYCDFLNDPEISLSNRRKWLKIKKSKIQKKGKKFSPKEGHIDTPVVMVSWEGATKFAKWLSDKDCIYDYELPTADEWEYAARGGPKKPYEVYAGTNDFKDFNQIKEIMDIGIYKPNSLGIHDMNTNVSEWCKDTYKEQGEIQGAKEVRGGNFEFSARASRTAARDKIYAREYKHNLGFRLVQRPKNGKDCE